MNMSQRREKMVEMINRERSVSFAQLKQFFHPASDMTLRRDLEYLDREKRIIRTHGGARSVEVLAGTDDLYLRRSTRNAAGKRAIAQKAAALLQPNAAIFLDSGTTCTEFAKVIPCAWARAGSTWRCRRNTSGSFAWCRTGRNSTM